MVGKTVLKTSYWAAEAGQVRDITVCETLYHAAATVPSRLALVDCTGCSDEHSWADGVDRS